MVCQSHSLCAGSALTPRRKEKWKVGKEDAEDKGEDCVGGFFTTP